MNPQEAIEYGIIDEVLSPRKEKIKEEETEESS
jgi:ATP-dependent protease ClpP protease subunit